MDSTERNSIMPSTAAVSSKSKSALNELQKRLQLLKMTQHEYVAIEKDFHRQFYELDMEFQKKRQTIYNRRRAIISGMGDENEQHIFEINIDSDIASAMQKLNFNNINTNDIKGVPGFWLQALKHCMPDLVRDCDEAILNYLIDIQLDMMNQPGLSFILKFEFAVNPFFEDSTLVKQYFLDCDDDEEFCGFSIVHTIGCKIQWNTGMDATNYDPNSFFMFFNPPDAKVYTSSEPQEPIVFDKLEHDFEIGLIFKEKLIPNAILYYLNEPEQIIDCSNLDNYDSAFVEAKEW